MTTPTLKTVNLLDSDSFKSYCHTALWSSTDDNCDPLDTNYEFDDIAQESLAFHRVECEKFVKANYSVLSKMLEDGYDMEMIMHDFWLTRNGHGCGFWDGDYPETIATILTDSAHSFGEANPYVGDDGLVYLS